jgi:hypothetical protein
MPLSTSNFERPLPDIPWLPVWGAAIVLFLAFAAFMEIRLAQLGYHSTVLDTPDRWVKQRIRASQLGEKALILIGASRIQLDIDLDVLRKETGLEPVQLAIDGSSFVPILKNLAEDPTIRGTVLVDYYPESVEGALSGDYGSATAFEHAYENQKGVHEFFSLARVEKYLSGLLHENLRSFADGATPLMSLHLRILPGEQAAQYLITLPDRSRLADYALVSMPDFYYKRVARNLGQENSINLAATDIEQILRKQVNLQQSRDNHAFITGARYLRKMIAAIKSRSGKVFFAAMPTSGMVREIDEKRYPRTDFLELFETEIGVPILNSVDDPELQSFACPDGSHLDYRDRSRFTEQLIHLLKVNHQVEARI